MEQMAMVQASALTFDQFRWIWVGLNALVGFCSIVGGVWMGKRKNVSPVAAQAVLLSLGIVSEDDFYQALEAQDLPPASFPSNPQVQHDSKLDGSPMVEQLIFTVNRSWGVACISSGIGMLLAAGVCAVLFLLIPVLSTASSPASADIAVIAELGLMLYLPVLGALTGLGVGRVTSLVNVALSPARHVITPDRPVQQAAKHWSAGLLWAWTTFFLIAVMLTLSALLAASSNRAVVLIVGVVVIPFLTLGAILLHERDLRRLASMLPLPLSDDPAWNERANASLAPRTVTMIKLLEYGLIGTMITCQLVVVLISSSSGAMYAALLGGLLALHLLSPLVFGLLHHPWGGPEV